MATTGNAKSLEDKPYTRESTIEGDQMKEIMMSRSDSGYSDGEGMKSPKLRTPGETTESEERSKNSETHGTKPSARESSKPHRVKPHAQNRRGSTRPSTSRRPSSHQASSSGELSKRKASTSTSPDQSGASSIRTAQSQATKNRRATLSNHRSLSYPQPTSSDIEHALAVHRKSCALFQSLTETVGTSSPPSNPIPHHDKDEPYPRPTSSPTFSNPTTAVSSPPVPASRPTAIHWTSHRTRRAEYAAIDRQHTGLRGLLRRLMPGCLHRSIFPSNRRGFYDDHSARAFPQNEGGEAEREGSKGWSFKLDGSKKKGKGDDADSVRRYRIEIPDDGEEQVGFESGQSTLTSKRTSLS